MELEDNYSKSSSEEADRSPEHNDHDDMGIGRSHECVFCKRGFTTAQALGGHMNIHRKDRANNNNKAKPTSYLPPSSSSKVIDTINNNNNYGDLIGNYYSPIPSHLAIRRGNYHSNVPDHEVIDNYHPIYLPPHASGATPSSHVQDWRKMGLSLYATNPLCVHESNDNIQDNGEEGGLDLELRLGYHP